MLFSFELIISRVAGEKIQQNSENSGFCKELVSEYDFEAVLISFCCYDYSDKASEAVQKMATDQKDYHKCSSCVSLLNSQSVSINNYISKSWLLWRVLS